MMYLLILWSIPACAGEPIVRNRSACLAAVYPRVCGGTTGVCNSGVSESGLSPRVRGNHPYFGRNQAPTRSIPACAGEPPRPWRDRAPHRVYPRVCGGTVAVNTVMLYEKGLSPRVRGNRTLPCSLRMARRSIPACAGEPVPPVLFEDSKKVYPRVCGGTDLEIGRVGDDVGLSPRVRGNPLSDDPL